MTFQYGATLRNNQISQIQTTIGTTGRIVIFSGAEPGNCSLGDPSGPLAVIPLPASFLTSSGGVTTIAPAGGWSAAASASGTALSWRMYDTASQPGGVCHVQGNMTDLTLNNTSITSGQTVTITSFSVTAGNQ
jgi:hypothetical protein